MIPDKVRVIEGNAIKRSLFEQLQRLTKLTGTEKLIGVVQGYALVVETEHGALGWIHWLCYCGELSEMKPGDLERKQEIFFKKTPQLFLV